jgi:hypothetical protein
MGGKAQVRERLGMDGMNGDDSTSSKIGSNAVVIAWLYAFQWAEGLRMSFLFRDGYLIQVL